MLPNEPQNLGLIEMETFLIGELVRRSGVNKETVRYYESNGLLDPPQRSETSLHSAGYRQYTEETVIQIKMIKGLQKIGFKLAQIKMLFELFDSGAHECNEFSFAIEERIEKIEAEIGRLQEIRSALTEMLAKCEEGGLLEACVMLDKLKRGEFLDNENENE